MTHTPFCGPTRTPRTNESTLRGHDRPTALDRLAERAARALLPSALTEEAWLRRAHADIPALEAWELRRELRLLTLYLDTAAAQRDFNRGWFEERVQRLRAELAAREGAAP